MPPGRWPAQDRQSRAAARSRRAHAAHPPTTPFSNLHVVYRVGTSHYLSGPGLYPIVLASYFARFHADRPAVPRRARLNTSGEPEGYALAIIEQPFYRVRYALGQSAAR